MDNPDLLEKFFSYLDPATVKTASLVSWTWNTVIEKPKFWEWAVLRLDRGNYQEVRRSLHTSQSRVYNVRKIRISVDEEEDNAWFLDILQDLVTVALDESSHLKSLDLAGSGLSSVDWASLSQVFLGQVLVLLDRGSFCVGRTSHGQIVRYKLTVSPGETTSWSISGLSPDQVRGFFTQISESSIMNTRSLWCVSGIPHISPELLSAALTRLEKVWVSLDLLTAEQISAVFTRLSEVTHPNLKSLNLGWNNLSSVPPDILAVGISRLEEARLFDTQLTTEQISAVFNELSVPESRTLRALNLAGNNLETVPVEVLVAGIAGLEVVGLLGTGLTEVQLTGIYSMVADRSSSRLKKIYLVGDRSSVSQDLRDRAQLNQSVQII